MSEPAYASIPRIGAGIVATGDTSRTAPTTFAEVLIPGGLGCRVERIEFTALGATTATILRLFVWDGTTFHIVEEIPVPTTTVVAGQPTWRLSREAVTTPDRMPKTIPPGWRLRATINDTQTGGGIKIVTTGGDFA